MKRPRRLLGTLLVSVAFLAPQLILPTKPALADKTNLCALPGQDGVASALSGAVNTYYPGTSASGTSITVGAARGATAIQAGDLLLVIQMQGAEIDATNTGTYGDGDSANNGTTGLPANPAIGNPNGNLNNANFTAGNFEYVVATSGVVGGTISISTSLVNTYSNANFGSQGQRRFQVIRIPQYTSATLSGTVTALPWDGTTGGIVAMDVAGTLNMGGQTINVTGQGFRGGGGRQLGGVAGGSNTDVRTLASVNNNAAKGEGTAGTPQYVLNSSALLNTSVEGYPSGSNGRGAPGNAGGGGTDGRASNNDQNAGGGGGSNGGIGGRGGNTWSSNLPYGGVGGAAFSAAAANRLVLGGGGGAGTTNNGTGTPGSGLASSGAAGGGSVLIRTGAIGTGGTITADGASPTSIPANDASGGGGAGGSVLVISQNNSAAGLTINARGGQGGTNTGGGSPHGPGGGGGGGIVFASPGTSAQLAGGAAGTTTGGVFGGATGGTGLSLPVSVTPADATTSIAGASCVPQLTVTKTTSTPSVDAGSTATYTITVANAANKVSATAVDISDALPAGFTYASVDSVNLSGGATRTTTTNPTVGATNPSFGRFTIPGGGQVQITFTTNVGLSTAAGTYQNPATATYLDPKRTTAGGTTTAIYDSASSTGEDVTVYRRDRSDAPITYGDSSHSVVSTIKLGAAIDMDVVSLASANADDDDTNGSDDEDGISAFPTLITGETSYSIPAANITATGTGRLHAWIDFNNSGTFEISEYANVVVTSGTLASALSWSGTMVGSVGNTYARFRFTSDSSVTASTPGSVASDGEVEDYLLAKVSRNPNVLLTKRITAINRGLANAQLFDASWVNVGTTTDDDNVVNWPGPATVANTGSSAGSSVESYIRGITGIDNITAVENTTVRPGDQLEYTIPFLSNGNVVAENVLICDRIPTNTTFVGSAFNSSPPAGAGFGDRGILVNFNGREVALTNVNDGDEIANTGGNDNGVGGYYFPPFVDPSTAFPGGTVGCGGTNTNGAIVVDLSDIPRATGEGTPINSYGFIRFRAVVN